MVALLGSEVGLELSNNEGTELGFCDGKVLGTTLVDMDRFSQGTYDGIDLGSTDGTANRKFEVLLLGASLG